MPRGAAARVSSLMMAGIYRLTGGRSGSKALLITTVGARSGESRVSHVARFADGDKRWLVVGSAGASAHNPGWVYNLEADPSARVAYGDRTVDVTARRADQDETDAALVAAARVYPGYDKYRERITGREVKVFVLTPSV